VADCIERCVGRTDVVALRVAEDKRLSGDVEERGSAEGKPVRGWTEAGASDDVRNVGVAELVDDGFGFFDVCLGGEHLGIALESEADRTGERYLCVGGGDHRGERRTRET
jgi:hypothetical protein